jgi:hypothetical protein
LLDGAKEFNYIAVKVKGYGKRLPMSARSLSVERDDLSKDKHSVRA